MGALCQSSVFHLYSALVDLAQDKSFSLHLDAHFQVSSSLSHANCFNLSCSIHRSLIRTRPTDCLLSLFQIQPYQECSKIASRILSRTFHRPLASLDQCIYSDCVLSNPSAPYEEANISKPSGSSVSI